MQLHYENIYIINEKAYKSDELEEDQKRKFAKELELHAMKILNYFPQKKSAEE